QPLRVISRGIEGHAERDVKARRKDADQLGLTVFGHAAKELDIAGTGFGKKDVAIRSAAHETRVLKTRGKQFYLESRRRDRGCTLRARHKLRRSGGGIAGERHGQ